MHGKGQLIFNTTNRRYVGDFVYDQIEGFGKFYGEDSVYEG